jgi:hypothetical protein
MSSERGKAASDDGDCGMRTTSGRAGAPPTGGHEAHPPLSGGGGSWRRQVGRLSVMRVKSGRGWPRVCSYLANLRRHGSDRHKLSLIYVVPNPAVVS